MLLEGVAKFVLFLHISLQNLWPFSFYYEAFLGCNCWYSWLNVCYLNLKYRRKKTSRGLVNSEIRIVFARTSPWFAFQTTTIFICIWTWASCLLPSDLLCASQVAGKYPWFLAWLWLPLEPPAECKLLRSECGTYSCNNLLTTEAHSQQLVQYFIRSKEQKKYVTNTAVSLRL